jgi:hypothetical protein
MEVGMTVASSERGVPRPRARTLAPAEFAAAVRSLQTASVRAEVRVDEVRPPQKLAPWSHAVALSVLVGEEEAATGRLVLLHDPSGYEAWEGTMRLVAYASAELDPEMAGDPLLPEVGWSWLIESLQEAGAEHRAVGGTVTQTSSTRFGDLSGPRRTTDLELRASWTPVGQDVSAHLQAFADLLCTAAGLPPAGVTALPNRG